MSVRLLLSSSPSTLLRLSSAPAGGRPLLSLRTLSVSATRLTGEEELGKAKEKLSRLKEDPGNDIKLKLYGLFKQVNVHCMQSISVHSYRKLFRLP